MSLKNLPKMTREMVHDRGLKREFLAATNFSLDANAQSESSEKGRENNPNQVFFLSTTPTGPGAGPSIKSVRKDQLIDRAWNNLPNRIHERLKMVRPRIITMAKTAPAIFTIDKTFSTRKNLSGHNVQNDNFG